MGQNSIIGSFFAQKAKKASAKARSPPQKLEIGPHSGPYFLVSFNSLNTFLAHAFKQCLERQTGRPIANVSTVDQTGFNKDRPSSLEIQLVSIGMPDKASL